MNILLISDFGINHNQGGAQRSNQIIIDEGRKRGHHIKTYHFDSHISILFDYYDIIISSNLEVISQVNPYIVALITNCNKHVRLEHDSCLYFNNDIRKLLFSNCKKTFFLTNFHYQKFIEYYGNYFVNIEIVPDPIDTDIFYNMQLNRSNDILYIGYMHPLKGTDNFIDYVNENPDKKFKVAAWGDEIYEKFMKNKKNVEFLGCIDHKDMSLLFNTHKQMYYNPECDEPFCRSVGEAILCGVEVIGNSNKIGSLHMYNEDKNNFAIKCHNAAKNFWEILENENF